MPTRVKTGGLFCFLGIIYLTVVRILADRHAIGPHARRGEAGETRKGLRADFGAQFDTHRCTARLVYDFFVIHPVVTDPGDLNSRPIDFRTGAEIYRVVFCFLSGRESVRGDDSRSDGSRVEKRRKHAFIGGSLCVRSPRSTLELHYNRHRQRGAMTTETPKVEFALGSEVSPGRFFKSAFARNFISSGRDCKSLDYELLDNAVVNDHREDRNNNARNNNFFSLVNFGDDKPANGADNDAPWEQPKPKNEAAQSAADANELEKLRKQCQLLKKENRRLQSAFLQNVFLQARVDTLQWQVKQVESNRHMYRSTMEQVAQFLGRVHRSLEILHSKENIKDKRRVPRSRSVHTVVNADPSPNRGTATPSSSSSTSSPFTRAKSVTQISTPNAICFREFTWSVLRRNDPVHCTSPRVKPPQDLNKTNHVPENVAYREPKQTEVNPDEIPPEKLSQEAFRLLRTVESLLAMREPDLARVTPIEDNGSSPSPTVDHRHHDPSLSLPSGNFANSTMLQEATYPPGNDHGNGAISSGQQDDSRSASFFKPSVNEFARDLQRAFAPSVRRSPDTASWNSSSSKTTEEEDTVALAIPSNGTTSNDTPSSTLSRSAKRLEKKESSPGSLTTGKTSSKVKPASSPVSSAEGESGFFSISSFQEVGLPPSVAVPIIPVKGCHTEVGLPEVPLDKARHRRWSSTPAEIQALFKHHRASFGGSPQTATESVSVCWV
ncbi:uncharacterized protein LOC114938366 [Nylanderia fulva]|uniref:uncharacterized protein LOC114938366 n=1 Tax=Nylanderia fulva TaxID=613905 RepID=UPI0010FB6F16|nr:uncharacterized protein LOC114938366 [Nylanderia fulva]